jgi:hypothetical protein
VVVHWYTVTHVVPLGGMQAYCVGVIAFPCNIHLFCLVQQHPFILTFFLYRTTHHFLLPFQTMYDGDQQTSASLRLSNCFPLQHTLVLLSAAASFHSDLFLYRTRGQNELVPSARFASSLGRNSLMLSNYLGSVLTPVSTSCL